MWSQPLVDILFLSSYLHLKHTDCHKTLKCWKIKNDKKVTKIWKLFVETILTNQTNKVETDFLWCPVLAANKKKNLQKKQS